MARTTWVAAATRCAGTRGAGSRIGPAGRAVVLALYALFGGATVQARAVATDAQVAREYRAQAALDIDADGRVTAVELSAEVPAVLAGPAKEAIAHWHFKPPVRDGHAVTARTYVRLALQVVQQADGNYGLRVVYRSNGPRLTFPQQPEYPRSELRQRGQGSLVMEAIVHPDGTLGDVHVASHRFNHPNPGAFIKSAEVVMQRAQAQPERVDGQPVATRIQVPFVYALHSITRSEALSLQSGKDGGAAARDGMDPVGDTIALDSPVQLMAEPPAEGAGRVAQPPVGNQSSKATPSAMR